MAILEPYLKKSWDYELAASDNFLLSVFHDSAGQGWVTIEENNGEDIKEYYKIETMKRWTLRKIKKQGENNVAKYNKYK